MRNIHFQQATSHDPCVMSAEEETVSSVYAPITHEPSTHDPDVRLKLRTVSVSPAEEYALRAGEVQTIPDSLAALILSRSGRVEINLKGVVVDRKDLGGRCTYWHPDSRVCSDLSFRSRKVFYVLNIHRPEVVHLLDEAGTYLESLPIKERPAVLDNEAQTAEARKNHRAIARAAAHLQRLHADDTRDALDALRHNAEATRRVVQTLPQPGCKPAADPVQEPRSALGETIAAAERDVMAGRANYDRTPAPTAPRQPSRTTRQPASDDLTETAAAILARRASIALEVDCPY